MTESFISRIGLASVFALSLMAASTANGAGTASGYSWTEILVPSIGPLGLTIGINDNDQVAVNNADGSKTGIYRKGIFTPLPPPPAGYTRVAVFGINNTGVIVGSAASSSDPSHEQGFILTGSTFRFFSRPGWSNTEPRAIANSGLITGFNYGGTLSNPDTSITAGFIYEPNTNTFIDATPPGPAIGLTLTQGMNAAGRITGSARLPDVGRYAFIWQQETLGNGTRQLAPFLTRLKIADQDSSARGINDAGVIVGFTGRPDGTNVGFVGSDTRGFQLLIPPGGDAPGVSVFCGGINNARKVVCELADASFNFTTAFVGSPDD